MKKARKLLVTLLLLTFVLSTFSVGFAADAEEKLPTEVVRAQALGILKGDDQGKLNLDKPITRAEALALIVRISGLETSADLMKGQTQFADVNPDPSLQWATGYINLGVGQGIVNGYPDGTFKGNNQVTYAEMAKMILYAMNYGVTVEGGQWPAAVMGKADDLKVFDKVNALPNIPALRGDVVKMIDNSLTIKHLKQTGYGDLKQYLEGEDSFLSKMDVTELKDVRVTEIARVNDKLAEDEIELTEYDKNGKVVDSDIYTLIADVSAEEIFGLEVDAWANDDDEVFFVKVKTAEKDILLDTVEKSDNKEITLKDADKTYKWDDKAAAYVNFKEVDLEDIDENAYGRVVLDKGRIAFVNLFEFDTANVGVVTKVNKDEIEYVDSNGNETDLNLDDYDDVYVYNPDFAKAEAKDIDEDSAIFFWDNKDDEVFIIVKNDSIVGKVDRVMEDKIKVDGKEYKKGDYAVITLDKGDNYYPWTLNKVEDFIDEEAKIVFDLRGRVLLATGDAEAKSGDMYGIVTYSKDGRNVTLTIFNEEGKEVDYKAEKGLDKAVLDLGVTHKHNNFAVIKFKLNSDGEIEEGDFTAVKHNTGDVSAKGIYAGELNKDSDSKAFKLGAWDTKYYISKDTVVMKAVDGTDLDPELLSAEKLISNSVDKNTDTQAIVFVKKDTKDAKFIVFTKAGFQALDDDLLYGVVTDGFWKEGKNYYSEINVFGEGTKEYKLKSENSFKNGAVVAFKLNDKDEAVLQGEEIAGPAAIVAYENGYLNGSIKVDSDAVIYTLKSSDKVDKKISASRLKDYVERNITYVLDDGILVAATISAKAADPTPEVKGKATYIAIGYDPRFDGTIILLDRNLEEKNFNLEDFDELRIGETVVSLDVMNAWLAGNVNEEGAFIIEVYVDVVTEDEKEILVVKGSVGDSVETDDAVVVFTEKGLKDALGEAEEGNNVILVYPGDYGTEAIEIIQQEGVNITLEAVGEVVLKNQIKIDGNARHNGEETLTIKGFTFDFSDKSGDIITTAKINTSNNSSYVYAHNITIKDCVFIGNSDNVVAVRASASGGHRNFKLDGCTGTNLHSLAQLTSVEGVTVKDCSVSVGEGGINLQNSTDITITNFTVDATGQESYGVRAGQSSGTVNTGNTMTISDSNLNAQYPIWLRGDAPGTVTITNSVLEPTKGGEMIYNVANGDVDITINGEPYVPTED